MADLVHINRRSLRTEPALAEKWESSPDGRRYTVHIRRGVRFSDGQPFEVEDVLFTFQLLLDPATGSPQRDLLMVHGKPVQVRKLDTDTVVFEFAEPYAPGERLFDSIAILPRHILEAPYREHRLGETWGVGSAPGQIVGLGPFRLREYVPGQRLVLEKNPYYWRLDAAGQRLPAVDRVNVLFVPTEDDQVLRFRGGETDLIARLGAKNFEALARRDGGYRMEDLGPSLEFNFLMFNLNDLAGRKLGAIEARQKWFQDAGFRRAVSFAIDRESIVRLVYATHGAPIWWHVSPGDRLWENQSLPKPKRSLEKARDLLRASGFLWDASGLLHDKTGAAVEFSLLTSAGNTDREQMATLVQADLRQLGITVNIVTLEFRSLLDRVSNSLDYESCLLALGGGDADPAPQMSLLLSSGATHLWDLTHKQPTTAWQAELDNLMKSQLVATYAERKRLYDRVQQIVAEFLPIICLASPNVLVGARKGLAGWQPGILPPYALANLDQVFWSGR
ncbi:MAG TPA: ABC transporter substrate-binding protein [Candidatus Acidoferrales bacterium]|nr:ABC transporter substrate-binding protein [Candidatus Acidoferrales bacterium]